MSNEFANLQIKVEQDDVPKAAASLDTLADASIRADEAVSGLSTSAPTANKALVGVAEAGAKASTGLGGLATGMDGFSEKARTGARTGREFETALAGMETGSRQGRAMMQNFSWQIQDVAVQAQMGTSALTVFAQQGPQMLSIFGAGGAVAGALVAVGALIATLATEADESTESFDKMLSKLDEMNAAQRTAFNITTVEEHNRLVDETNKMYADLTSKAIDLEREQKRAGSTWKLWADNAKENIAGIIEDMDLLKGKIADNEAKIKEYQKGLAASKEAANGMSQAVKDTVESLEIETASIEASTYVKKKLNLERDLGRELTKEEAAELKTAADAQDAKTDATKRAKEAQREAAAEARKAIAEAKKEANQQAQLEKQADSWLERVDYYGQSELDKVRVWQEQEIAQLQAYLEKKAITSEEGEAAYEAILDEAANRRMEIYTKESEHKEREAEKIKQSQERAVSMWLDTTSTMLQATTTMLEDSGAENTGFMKLLLAAQKALAIPSILVSTEQAAMAAEAHETLLGGIIAGQTAAALIRAQGAISVGIVAGTAIAGLFDTGGVIPAGQAGIVGEFGPEIVRGPAVVTSRSKTAEMAQAALGQGSTSSGQSNVFHQTFIVQGNGDSALKKAMQEAARMGSEDALNRVKQDAATNGEIRRMYNV